MRGALPKPTILELDEYDINQRIIEALTTTCSHAILFSIVDIIEDSTRALSIISFVEPSNTEYGPIQVEPPDTTDEPLEEVFGEIVISFCQATRQAKEKHCLIHNEIALLVIHGVLHLLGYDHAKVKEKRIMWQHQNASLDLVFRSN